MNKYNSYFLRPIGRESLQIHNKCTSQSYITSRKSDFLPKKEWKITPHHLLSLTLFTLFRSIHIINTPSNTMDSFSATINKTINAVIVSTVKNYVNEFASRIVKEVNSKDGKKKEWKVEDFVSLWNGVAKEFVVKKGGKKEKSEPVDPDCQCVHVFGKGDKKDERCAEKISDKSTTKMYCVRHYKQQEKDKKPKKDGEECSGECCYILTKGENEGDECGVKVSAKSKSGKFCSKHIGEEKKAKKINKTELLKFIREKTKDVDEEDGEALKEALKEVETKFGYMTLYNMDTLAPKMYEKFQTTIDELIDDGREDNSESIKEAEEEAEEESKKETKKGSDKKVVKSGSDKKVVKSGYEDGEKLVAGSPRLKDVKNEEEEVEDEEEELSIKAKKFKSGDLKGQVYFIDEKTETTFLLNSVDRTVSHKVVDNKKVNLSSEDKIRIAKYQLTASE